MQRDLTEEVYEIVQSSGVLENDFEHVFDMSPQVNRGGSRSGNIINWRVNEGSGFFTYKVNGLVKEQNHSIQSVRLEYRVYFRQNADRQITWTSIQPNPRALWSDSIAYKQYKETGIPPEATASEAAKVYSQPNDIFAEKTKRSQLGFKVQGYLLIGGGIIFIVFGIIKLRSYPPRHVLDEPLAERSIAEDYQAETPSRLVPVLYILAMGGGMVVFGFVFGSLA